MLTISAGTRSTSDPLYERTLDLAMDPEFMELTGFVFLGFSLARRLIFLLRPIVKCYRLPTIPPMAP
jgi:hypothetical protein